MFSLDRCNGSCNALDHLSSKICVSNKTKDVNLYVFNIITEINEQKTLKEHISCNCKYQFDGRKVE